MEFMTADELAAKLRVRPGTVRTWARRGLIPLIRISPKVVRFDPQAVIDAIRRRNAEEASRA